MLPDKDLLSIQEARNLLKEAKNASFKMLDYDQSKVDKIVIAMSKAAHANAERLAKLAVSETGYGNVPDKTFKNQFAAKNVLDTIGNMKTVGIINRNQTQKTFDVAVPMGIVAGIIPSTNPTSTAIYKALISVKGRNSIVMSPHPSARKCILETVNVLKQAAENAGAPKNLISCMTEPSLEGTHELFSSDDTAIILATGGSAMVKAAYRSGRPAIGVGPGNVPAFIEKSADVARAVSDVVAGKAFDYGTICASEQAVIVDKSIASKAIAEFEKNKAFFCNAEQKEKIENLMVVNGYQLNAKVVGQSPENIARMAGFEVPKDTTILIVRMQKIGREDPLSFEKLSPVLCFYEAADWQEGCKKAIEILNYGGIGHTMSIHSQNEKIIEEFALYKPAFRIIVNSSSTHGAIGASTNLPAALTLGPGAMGGSSSSDNISPLHLINIKHVAYGVRDVPSPAHQNVHLNQSFSPQAELDNKKEDPVIEKIEKRVLEVLQQRKQEETNHYSSSPSKNLNDDEIDKIINEVRNNS